MRAEEIYAKSELGAQELKVRKLELSTPLRSLLIMVDGQRTVAQIMERTQALGLDIKALQELERLKLITKKFSAPSSAFTVNGEASVAHSLDEARRFDDARRMMVDAVKQYLGFRGYGLSVRLQRAMNLRDLHDLLPDFASALVKRIGIQGALPVLVEVTRLIATPSD